MTVPVFITIDTEEDRWDSYHTTDNPVENVDRLPRLQELCDRYGAIPTYLVNYPVASTPSSLATLRALVDAGRCEIGAHCHPWNTPPFANGPAGTSSMLSSLPAQLVREKLAHLHGTIAQNLGVTPVSFRAGRGGFNGAVAVALRDLGYRVDSSVVPFADLTQFGGPNYESAPYLPYRFEPERSLEFHARGELLEVPQTIGFLQRDFRSCSSMRQRMARGLWRKAKLLGALDVLKLLNLRKLTPEETSLKDMIALAERCLAEGYACLHMALHSSALMPGENPFAPTGEKVDEILARIEGVLRFCASKGFCFYGLAAAQDPGVLRGSLVTPELAGMPRS